MDSLEIQGKTYISSKRAAELTGYAKDYIGQLARSGKLPGTRVGRSWYVDADTLAILAKLPAPATPQPTSSVTAVSSQTALITLAALRSLSHEYRSPINTWDSIVYSPDDDPLIPPVRSVDTAHTTEHRVAVSVRPKNIHISSRISRISDVDGVRVGAPLTRSLPANTISDRSHELSVPQVILVASGALALVVIAFSVTGQWTVVPQGSGQAAQALTGGASAADFQGYFGGLFHTGVELIRSFFGHIFSSGTGFFLQGVEFFVRLFHLG